MAFIVSKGSSFVPCPAGPHSGVCVDVVDLGLVETTFNGKTKKSHKCRLVWQVAELNQDGKPYLVQKQYTASLHEKAALRLDLQSWRGRPFTEQEAQGFDVEVLIGKACLLNVQHVDRNGSTYANVTGVMPLPKGMPVMQPSGYVRVKDRVEPSPSTDSQHDDPFGSMDDVPF
jgi:hypothetical protein